MLKVIWINLLLLYQCNAQCLNFMCIIQQITQAKCNDLGCSETSTWQTNYDFIIVGGGAAGCVLANRLSENPNWNILLLETGIRPHPYTEIPLMSGFLHGLSVAWNIPAEPGTDFCLARKNKICFLGGGRALGGSTVINGMIYTRGLKTHLDEWEALGNYGWSFDKLQPFVEKVENFNTPDIKRDGSVGVGGMVSIETPKYKTAFGKDILQAGTEMGYNITSINARNIIGVSILEQTLKNGRRFHADKAYIKPIENRTNLHISLMSTVSRIIIEPSTRSAVGVEFTTKFGSKTAFATKEVIVSAGALSSPKLLMLSGIGPKSHLEELKIPVISNLPVGTLSDHMVYPMYFVAQNKSALNLPDTNDPKIFEGYFTDNTGPLLSSGTEAAAFFKTDENIPGNVPDIELMCSKTKFSRNLLAMVFGGLNDEILNGEAEVLDGKEGVMIFMLLVNPKSLATVKLRSRDFVDDISVNLKAFSAKEDLPVMVAGIKKTIKLMQQPAFKNYQLAWHIPEIPKCKQLTHFSDEFFECMLRHLAAPGYHYVRTCKMGPENDPESVVDPELRVRGIKNLRVVDNSVAPTIPRGHTQSTAYMIGEKGADMIKKFWT